MFSYHQITSLHVCGRCSSPSTQTLSVEMSTLKSREDSHRGGKVKPKCLSSEARRESGVADLTLKRTKTVCTVEHSLTFQPQILHPRRDWGFLDHIPQTEEAKHASRDTAAGMLTFGDIVLECFYIYLFENVSRSQEVNNHIVCDMSITSQVTLSLLYRQAKWA